MHTEQIFREVRKCLKENCPPLQITTEIPLNQKTEKSGTKIWSEFFETLKKKKKKKKKEKKPLKNQELSESQTSHVTT